MPETLTVVTPWYPSPDKPSQGSFVEAQVRAVQPLTGRIDVLATEGWIVPRRPFLHGSLRRQYAHVSAGAVRPVFEDGVWLTRLPVLVQPRRAWAEYARSVAQSVRAARGGRPFDAVAVQAHVGLPGGLVAVENAPAGARVVVTEHASYLADILAEPAAGRCTTRRCTGPTRGCASAACCATRSSRPSRTTPASCTSSATPSTSTASGPGAPSPSGRGAGSTSAR